MWYLIVFVPALLKETAADACVTCMKTDSFIFEDYKSCSAIHAARHKAIMHQVKGILK